MNIASAKPTKSGAVVTFGSAARFIGNKNDKPVARPFNDAMMEAAAHRRRMAPVLRSSK